jgi:hypothetical protein
MFFMKTIQIATLFGYSSVLHANRIIWVLVHLQKRFFFELNLAILPSGPL